MGLARLQLVIATEAGDIVDGATLTLTREFGAGMGVGYSDYAGATSLGSSWIAADGADAGFHAAGGLYRIDAVKDAFSRTWRYVAIGTAQSVDLPINGYVSRLVTEAGDVDVLGSDYAIFVKKDAGENTSINFPALADRGGSNILIADVKGDANLHPITPVFDGSELCDGQAGAAFAINSPYGFAEFAPLPDSSAWKLVRSSEVSITDDDFVLKDGTDATKKLKFQLSGITSGQTRTLTAPDADATIVGADTTQTLTNKTLDTAGPNTIKVNGNTLAAGAGSATVTLPNSTDTLVGRATADTLTNKTINAVNNTISNLATSMFAANVVDTDGTLAANSDTRLATQKATKTYVDQIVAANDAMVFKGVIDCSANPNYPAADRGWTYRVSVAGKIGGASGPNVEAGDILLCLTDGTASGDQATVGASWGRIQVDIDGAVTLTGTQTLTNKTLTAPIINGGTHDALTSLGIRSTGAAFDVKYASAEVLTGNRTLSWVLGDANRSISLGGNVTIAGAFTISGAFGVTLTATALTSITLPTTGTLATLAGAETLTNKTLTAPSIASPAITGTVDITQALKISGDITPAQITADVDDYAPTGFATASVLRLDTDSSHGLNGLAGGTNGRLVSIVNIGGSSLVAKNGAGSSAAANRLDIGADVTIGSKQGAILRYDGTASRWRMLAGPVGAGGGGGSGTVTDISAGVGLIGGTISTSGTIALDPNVIAQMQMLAMQVAELSTDRINMVDGIVDPFKDTTDVDVAGATNLDTGTAGLLKPTVPSGTAHNGETANTTVDYSTGYTVYDGALAVTNGAVVAAIAVYSTVAKTLTVKVALEVSSTAYTSVVSESFVHGGTGWEIKTLSAPYTVPGSGTYRIGAFILGATMNAKATGVSRKYKIGDLTGAQTGFGSDAASGVCVRWYEPGTTSNLTARSTAFTAGYTPSKARLSAVINPVDAITINTDVIGKVTRDGGTTYTTATLALFATLADGSKLYMADEIDISAQPSGTSMRWRFETANNKMVQFLAASLKWRA